MATRKILTVTCVLCLAVLLGGCVTSSGQQAASAGEDLRHKNMDVLFATEFPVESMDEALTIAGQSLNSGEVDKALFFYVRALQFEPTNVVLLTHIGDIHMRRGDEDMAKRAFLRAKQHDREYAPALESLGLLYAAEGREEDAIQNLSLAIGHDDQRWRAHNALGIYADKAGDHRAALAHYQAAIAINPDAIHVLNNIGYSRYLAGDIEGAMADLERAAMDKGFDRAWGNLAIVLASQGRYEDAVTAYREVMSDANAYHATGKAAVRNGDLQQAYSLISEAISQSTTYFPEAEKSLKQLKANGVTAGPLPIAAMRGGASDE
jgi:Flp pilus assembly protein TadD